VSERYKRVSRTYPRKRETVSRGDLKDFFGDFSGEGGGQRKKDLETMERRAGIKTRRHGLR